MFRHPAKKLKVTAIVVAALLVAACLVAGLILITSNGITLMGHKLAARTAMFGGLGVIVVGCVLAWLVGLVIYGFGELIEKTKDNNYLLSRIASHTKAMHEEQMRE